MGSSADDSFLRTALLGLALVAGCSERALPITEGAHDFAASPDLGVPSDLAAAHDLAVHIDLAMLPDLEVRSDLAVPPDFAAPADLAAVCGNGRRDGLEGCDDGNTVSGDGCRADCVIEGARLPIFKDLHGTGLAVFSIAASHSGLIYLGESRSPVARVHRMAQDGTITQNIVAGLQIENISLAAVTEDLVIGGQSSTGPSSIYGWSAQSGTTTSLYSEPRMNGVVSVVATDLGLTKTIYSDQNGQLRRAVSSTASVTYGSAAGAMTIGSRPNGTIALLGINQLYADDGAGSFTQLSQYTPSGTEYWEHLTADGESTVYLACIKFVSSVGAGGCASGALWAVDAKGTEARPFVDSFAQLDGLTWDPASNHLVMVVGTSVLEPKIVRVPLAR